MQWECGDAFLSWLLKDLFCHPREGVLMFGRVFGEFRLAAWERVTCPYLSCHSFLLVRAGSADAVLWTQFLREAGNRVFNFKVTPFRWYFHSPWCTLFWVVIISIFRWSSTAKTEFTDVTTSLRLRQLAPIAMHIRHPLAADRQWTFQL